MTAPETGESFPADVLTGHLLAMLQAGGLVQLHHLGLRGPAAAYAYVRHRRAAATIRSLLDCVGSAEAATPRLPRIERRYVD